MQPLPARSAKTNGSIGPWITVDIALRCLFSSLLDLYTPLICFSGGVGGYISFGKSDECIIYVILPLKSSVSLGLQSVLRNTSYMSTQELWKVKRSADASTCSYDGREETDGPVVYVGCNYEAASGATTFVKLATHADTNYLHSNS